MASKVRLYRYHNRPENWSFDICTDTDCAREVKRLKGWNASDEDNDITREPLKDGVCEFCGTEFANGKAVTYG